MMHGNQDARARAIWWNAPFGNGTTFTNESGEPISAPTALRTTVPSSGNCGAWQATASLSRPREWFLGYKFKLDPAWLGHEPDGVLKVLWVGSSPDQLITKA